MSAREKKRSSVEKVCQKMILSDKQLCDISNKVLTSINQGLSKEGHRTAAARCFPTFVQDFPTGNEVGRYLALDLGGTNFRVLMVTLKEGNKFEMIREKYQFSKATKIGPGPELFDYVAQCVKDFCEKHDINAEEEIRLPMGFTFSFPIQQVGLNAGILVKWTKGFSASGVVGKNVVQLLNEAFHRQGLHETLKPVAILNDTTGTLMSCAWDEPDTRVGLIIGTGSNACYTEKIENIKILQDGEYDKNKPHMIINTEWGNFGADGVLEEILTEFDKALDSNSSHRGEQVFEKLIAGRYLGEVMRLVIVKLINEKILFQGQKSEKILSPYEFKTEFITNIENDPDGTFENAKAVLKTMDINTYNEQDLVDLRYIAEIISTRSAALVSSAIATLLNKMEISPVTVGVDGTVYRQHPNFKRIMEEKIKCLVKPNIKFKLALSEDGSGRGAAFVAAVFKSQQDKKKK